MEGIDWEFFLRLVLGKWLYIPKQISNCNAKISIDIRNCAIVFKKTVLFSLQRTKGVISYRPMLSLHTKIMPVLIRRFMATNRTGYLLRLHSTKLLPDISMLDKMFF